MSPGGDSDWSRSSSCLMATVCILNRHNVIFTLESRTVGKKTSVKEKYWTVKALSLLFCVFVLGTLFEMTSLYFWFLPLLTFCWRPKRNVQGPLKNHWKKKGKRDDNNTYCFPFRKLFSFNFFLGFCWCCYYNHLKIANLKDYLWYHKKKSDT